MVVVNTLEWKKVVSLGNGLDFKGLTYCLIRVPHVLVKAGLELN